MWILCHPDLLLIEGGPLSEDRESPARTTAEAEDMRLPSAAGPTSFAVGDLAVGQSGQRGGQKSHPTAVLIVHVTSWHGNLHVYRGNFPECAKILSHFKKKVNEYILVPPQKLCYDSCEKEKI